MQPMNTTISVSPEAAVPISSNQKYLAVAQRWLELVMMILVLILMIAATGSNDWIRERASGGTAYFGLYMSCLSSPTSNCNTYNHNDLSTCASQFSGDQAAFCKDVINAQGLMPAAVVFALAGVIIQAVIACTCGCCTRTATGVQRTGIVGIILNAITFALGVSGYSYAHDAYQRLIKVDAALAVSTGNSMSTAVAAWVLALVGALLGIACQFIKYYQNSQLGSTAALVVQYPPQSPTLLQQQPEQQFQTPPQYFPGPVVYASGAIPPQQLQSPTLQQQQFQPAPQYFPSPSFPGVYAPAASPMQQVPLTAEVQTQQQQQPLRPTSPSGGGGETKFCTTCGFSLSLQAKFCAKCGTNQE
jgi:hypothetical protein